MIDSFIVAHVKASHCISFIMASLIKWIVLQILKILGIIGQIGSIGYLADLGVHLLPKRGLVRVFTTLITDASPVAQAIEAARAS